MRWLAILAAVLVAGIAASRLRVRRRFNAFLAFRPPPPLGSDGIIDGAESISVDGSGERAALLLHGFNDTPQSVASLATALHARGWTVRAPLLPRHGRALAELTTNGDAREWIDAARAEWSVLRRRHGQCVLIGQSMGGAIATVLAAEAPPQALVLLAPYLVMGPLPRMLTHVWPLWQLVTPRLFADSRRGLRDATARANSLGHGVFTPRLVHELRRVVDAAWAVLPQVKVPTLVLHAERDYRIPSHSAERAYARVGTAEKELVWCADSGHVLAADSGREAVARTVGEWLERRVAASQAYIAGSKEG